METSKPTVRHKATSTRTTPRAPIRCCYILPSLWSYLSSVLQQGFTTLVLVQKALMPCFCSIVDKKVKAVYTSPIFLLSFCAYTHPRTTWPEIFSAGTVRNWNTSTQAVLNFSFTKHRWAETTDLSGMSPSIWNETLPATWKHRSTVALVNRRETLKGEKDQPNKLPKMEFYWQFGELSNLRWLGPWGMKGSRVCKMRDCRNLPGEQVVHNKERILANCCSEIIYRKEHEASWPCNRNWYFLRAPCQEMPFAEDHASEIVLETQVWEYKEAQAFTSSNEITPSTLK